MKLFASTVIDRDSEAGLPGQVLGLKDECLAVGTKRGIVGVRELQSPGRNRIAAKEFLRGFPIPEGAMLGR
jgi:methionyl-tRNA formyltransferase